jgi:AcrR family transcriptional regulator
LLRATVPNLAHRSRDYSLGTVSQSDATGKLTDVTSVNFWYAEVVQRARSEQNRAERYEAILSATAHHFDLIGPDLTLAHVANTSGLTRTTLYGYATSREELLLALTDRELTDWFERVNQSMLSVRSVSGTIRVVIDEILLQPRLAPLLALCNVMVERNVSYTAAATWKTKLQHQILELGSVIDSTCKAQSGSGARFLLHVHASLTGLHSLAFPSPVALKAISDEGLRVLDVDLATELRIAIPALARAILL